ncbi:hypothetical protein B0H12DRAFT_364661 [Mycena haematopus]|nr:hypothetical protein B0H12DRAFT_364661 [Mycena haematopus]
MGPGAQLAAFLKTITNLDLTCYQPLLEMQGFTISRLRTVAMWTPDEIHEGLERLLMDGPTGHPCMPALYSWSSKMACVIFKARERLHTSSQPRCTTMPLLLKNVMGLDLSQHAELIDTQGFSISALDSMLSWDLARIQRKLKFTLLDPACMSRMSGGNRMCRGRA